eukprot:213826-Pyramimonas_sp.AAC.1
MSLMNPGPQAFPTAATAGAAAPSQPCPNTHGSQRHGAAQGTAAPVGGTSTPPPHGRTSASTPLHCTAQSQGMWTTPPPAQRTPPGWCGVAAAA